MYLLSKQESRKKESDQENLIRRTIKRERNTIKGFPSFKKRPKEEKKEPREREKEIGKIEFLFNPLKEKTFPL